MTEVKKATAAAKPAEVEKETKAEVKTAAKETAKKAPAKKASTKKTTVKKTEEKKTEEKKTEEKKAPEAKKEEVEAIINFQFSGKEYKAEDFVNIAKDVWKYDLGNKIADFKSVELYIKPEENKTYYVINGDVSGSFDI